MQRIITAFLLSLVLSGCATVKATYEVTDILEQRTWEETWEVKGDTLSVYDKETRELQSTSDWLGRVITTYSADGKYEVMQNTVTPIDWLSAGEKTFGHVILRQTEQGFSSTGLVTVRAEQVQEGRLRLITLTTLPLPSALLHEEITTTHRDEVTFFPERREDRYVVGGELQKHLVYVKKR